MVLNLVLLAAFIHAALSQHYVNPVVSHVNVPDPGVLHHEGFYWAVTTSGDAKDSFPIRRSKDLVHWELVGHVFPAGSQPDWSLRDFWAPELHVVDGKIVCYFAARNREGVLCVGAARADRPEGPYSKHPPLVQDKVLGNIDPTYVEVSADEKYLVWKLDGNGAKPQIPSVIYIQQLQKDGLSLISNSRKIALLNNTLSWEGAVVEAPWLINRNNYWYLFYSANGYASPGPAGSCLYSVGVARSKSLTGPYEKRVQPILSSVYVSPGIPLAGPGHCSVVRWNATADYMVYHAWRQNEVGGAYPRLMCLDRVIWGSDYWPVVHNGHPSYTAQPIP
eukprot:TRINITY_DN12325_c0_g1_i1.p1 TRINITY_DN12325_c0_g1~~TRINITY_DN12325_c0_g1_i1.p1  ORF type:complete len:334 (-),score=54.18 TRINITY_DN12325_c0_g1_i1:55-1056(-)